MSVVRFVSASVAAVALAAMPVVLSAEGNTVPSKEGKASSQFAALKGVKAVPMAAKELDKVKGLHVHFFNGSNNVVDTPGGPVEGLHLAGANNTDNWSNLYGQGLVANSYHGLCTAATNGHSAIFINPGGGCGF